MPWETESRWRTDCISTELGEHEVVVDETKTREPGYQVEDDDVDET